MLRSRAGMFHLFPAAALAVSLAVPVGAHALASDAGDSSAASTAPEQGQHAKETKAEKTPEQLAKKQEEAELDKLKREAQLQAARLKAELTPLMEQKLRLETELALLTARQKAVQAKAKLNKEQGDFNKGLELAGMARELSERKQELEILTVKGKIHKLISTKQVAEIGAENAKLAAKMALLQTELNLVKAKRAAASVDRDEMMYPAEPFKDGLLTINDRRIPLNGPIAGGTATYVTERIHYFNNLDPEAPIFIVIDNSPGGSVMEGFRILTAMQNSKAPIHVVVKSFAASMAAAITTLADESYAYPNAIILHHQMSSGMRGNLTQQAESLKEMQEWSDRLAVPIAQKMGVAYEKFVELMYENVSTGDWAEFADKAKELKWVNNIVTEIRETALVTAPGNRQRGSGSGVQADGDMPRPFSQHELFHSPIHFQTKSSGNGKSYIELPAPGPFDYYFMYDPNQRYQIAH